MRVFSSRFALPPVQPFIDLAAGLGADQPLKVFLNQTIVRSSRTSPGLVPDGSRLPADSSTTAKARHAARTRQGRTPDEVLSTRPDRSRNTRSSGNRMKAVWTLEQGARIERFAGCEPAPAEQALPPGARIEGGDHGAGYRFAGPNVPQPVPALRLPHERGEAVGQPRGSRESGCGSAPAGRRGSPAGTARSWRRQPASARGSGWRATRGGRARRRRTPSRRTPASRSARRARRVGGCPAGAGGSGLAGVTWGSPAW